MSGLGSEISVDIFVWVFPGNLIYSYIFPDMSSISSCFGYTMCWVYAKYWVIPGISGYPIPDDFQS